MTTRDRIKRIVKTGFLILVTPLFLLYRLLSLVGGKDSAFQSFSQLISLIPGKTGVYIRAAFYRLACPETSDEISVGFLTVFSHQNTTIGRGVYIGPQCNIGMCSVGENTLIGSGVHILSGNKQHSFNNLIVPIKDQKSVYTKIRIGNDCWIGNNASVLANIDEKTVIAAASVVIKPATAHSVYAGNPAKLLKVRDHLSEEIA